MKYKCTNRECHNDPKYGDCLFLFYNPSKELAKKIWHEEGQCILINMKLEHISRRVEDVAIELYCMMQEQYLNPYQRDWKDLDMEERESYMEQARELLYIYEEVKEL